MAERAADLVDAISPALARSRADSLVAEVLPLLAACEFLERNATALLKARRLGRSGRPFWLGGVTTRVERVPLGVVLVIAPANYPLFLGGVQVLQALAAGNAVVLKPGRGGRAVASRMALALREAGLPDGLLTVTDESVEAGLREIEAGPDKIFFTGSSEAGRSVMRLAANTATPVVAELSGCDAVFVLPSADIGLVVDALAFGMRFNGSATCMAPRRLVLIGAGHDGLMAALQERFQTIDGIAVESSVREQLSRLTREASRAGATIIGDVDAAALRPILVTDASPSMRIAQSDLFVPVLNVIQVANLEEAIAAEQVCPYGLTAAVFGERRAAEELASRLEVGTVLVNDLIVPTADPRVSFGGRRGSGFGSTRGAEGLLEMTAVRTVAVRTGKSRRRYETAGALHERMFQGVVEAGHAGTLRGRFRGLVAAVRHAARLK